MSFPFLRRRGEISVAKNQKTGCGQNKSADDVDQVVLIGQEWRERDQDEPNHDRDSNETARVAKINVDQN